jgi:transposase-like protein
MGRTKRRAFTPELKAEAVRLAKAGGRSIGRVTDPQIPNLGGP